MSQNHLETFQAVSLECSSDQEAFALFEHLFMGGVFGTNLFDYPLGQSINILMFTIAFLFSCTTESLNLWMKQINTYQETARTAYIHRKLTGIHQDMIYDPLTRTPAPGHAQWPRSGLAMRHHIHRQVTIKGMMTHSMASFAKGDQSQTVGLYVSRRFLKVQSALWLQARFSGTC